jgi:holo-[acyl-carrier protein] synthase
MTPAIRIASELEQLPSPLRVGVDVVLISHLAESLRTFGNRYIDRLFTRAEANYATAVQHLAAERLAARFAAKEATVKALGWSQSGVNLREIEVVRDDSGACELSFHGHAAALFAAGGHARVALSMSHDGDYAAAVVATLPFTSSTCDPHDVIRPD